MKHPAPALIRSTLLTSILVCVTLANAVAREAAPVRNPWTTSRLHGSPEPPKPYVSQQIYPALKFREITEIVFDPVGRRWVMLERLGKIFLVPQGEAQGTATLLGDLKALHPELDNLYGFAFHPQYKENHQVFITYTVGSGIEDGTKLSRFELTEAGLLNEHVILTWRSGGHNGANLQFGGDGCLYVSTGDSEVPSPPDPLNTGQDVTDLLSSILRIDVDHPEPGKTYAIPKDNPFVGASFPARPEIWAYGLRNPWKMSFDRATGRLWCADVGWELWEMVHLIEPGGNYGWSAMEASQPVRADAPKPPTPIRPPVIAHSHDEAASITGGYVYHGKKFPELAGAYLYGDWETGKIWALWHDGKQVTRHQEIADTPHRIIAFGQDAEGELIYAHYHQSGTLHTLERNAEAGKGSAFPRTLSETGLFKDVNKQAPADGVYQIKIRHSMWDQSAGSQTLLALPGTEQIRTKIDTRKEKDGSTRKIATLLWPTDSVVARTLTVETTKATSKTYHHERVETQILHFDGSGWNAYSYQWRPDQTDADLVPASGGSRRVMHESWLDPKVQTPVDWHFHSRAECLRCHNSWCGGTLSINAAQLDLEFSMATTTGSPADATVRRQLDDLIALGLVDAPFRDSASFALASRMKEVWDLSLVLLNKEARPAVLEQYARSYLHVNCSPCHRQNAGGAVTMMLNAELPAAEMLALGVVPQQGGLGLQSPKLIDPGQPWNSVICVRLATTGNGHMPVIGPRVTDVEGLKLIEDWIASMKPGVTSASELLPREWSEALLREKLATVEGGMQVRRAVDEGTLKEPLLQTALDLAWQSPQQTVRDLFERFKPESLREATIGLNPDAAALLAMRGDAKRGAGVVSLQGKLAACYACHLISGTGRDFGPDLSKVGARLQREQLLESLLHPSKVIAPGYTALTVEMRDGTTHAGFIVKEVTHDLTLKSATGETALLMKSDIHQQTRLPASLMPEGQLQSLTAQEVADVLAYLTSLK